MFSHLTIFQKTTTSQTHFGFTDKSQILREIKVSESIVFKPAVSTHLEARNFHL